jgi:hypothetical protein
MITERSVQVPRPVNIPRMWRPNFPFLCVARRLKCTAFRPPRALMKEKFDYPIHGILTGCGTSDYGQKTWAYNVLLFLKAIF